MIDRDSVGARGFVHRELHRVYVADHLPRVGREPLAGLRRHFRARQSPGIDLEPLHL
jgi:hypothetical protein